LEAAEALIGLGAKVNLPGRAGVTPLSAAAFNSVYRGGGRRRVGGRTNIVV